MRCPIASTPSTPWIALASCASSSRPSETSNSRSKRILSSPSTKLSLTELEPALRTRTRNALVRPGPVGDLGCVPPMVPRVLAGVQPLVDHGLADVRRFGAERWDAIDDVHHE